MKTTKKLLKATKLIEKINLHSDSAQLCITDKMRYDNIRPLQNNTIKINNKLPVQSLDYVRLRELQLLSDEIKQRGLTGSIAEAGVYKGFFARKMNYLFPEKTFYLFDTFGGFDDNDIQNELSINCVDKTFVKTINNFGKTNVNLVLKNMPNIHSCRVVEGKIPQSFEGIDDIFCLVSIDLDFYKATVDALNYFYPRLEKGGYILLHDYNHDQLFGVKKAFREFLEQGNISYVPVPDEGGTCIITKSL